MQCSRDDVGSRLRKDIKDIPAVHISNPKTLEFQVTMQYRKLNISSAFAIHYNVCVIRLSFTKSLVT